MKKIVILPTYNEVDNIAKMADEIRRLKEDFHILIVDDNSKDGTAQAADRLSKQKYPGKVFVLHRQKKEGLGKAYIAGFQWALDQNYEVIFQMDADFSHLPSYLPLFLHKIQEGFDLVIGSRYLNGISVVNWDLKRLLLSKLASIYVQKITKMPVKDPTSGFKCWRNEALRKIHLHSITSSGYGFQIETNYRAWQRGLKITEIPIIFYERRLGVSKMNKKIIWEAFWLVWKLRLFNSRNRK